MVVEGILVAIDDTAGERAAEVLDVVPPDVTWKWDIVCQNCWVAVGSGKLRTAKNDVMKSRPFLNSGFWKLDR